MAHGTYKHYCASFIILLLVCTTIKLTFKYNSRCVIHALHVVSSYLIHNLVRLSNNKAHITLSVALLYMPSPRRPMPAAISTQLAALRPLPAA
jgi:hypothetical protein